METGNVHPTPDEARAALEQVGNDVDTVRYPPLPWWFFAVQATLIAGLNLAQMLPSSEVTKATAAIGIVAIVLGTTSWLRHDGVSWTSVDLGDMLPFLAGILGAMAVCWLVDSLVDAPWMWILGAATTATIVLVTGRSYRRTFGG